MKKSYYPRIGKNHQLKNRIKCEGNICRNNAARKVDVQRDDDRDNDEVFLVCYDHLQMALSRQWDRFFQEMPKFEESS